MEKNNGTFRTSIGGQALIEGILMRGPKKQAIVVRSPEGLVTKVEELTLIRENWRELSAKMQAQIMPFDEVRAALKAVGAPYEPEMIGVTRARFRETFVGVPYMRNRFFALDLVMQLGLMPDLVERLFGKGGIWEV